MTQNQTQEPKVAQEENLIKEEEVREFERCHPKVPNNIMGSNAELVQIQDFWFPKRLLKNILWFQRSFKAQDTDLIIASLPKCGTTWLKSLLFAVVNRVNYPTKQSPLLTNHPHDLVYRLENGIYGESTNYIRPSSLDQLPSPRLLNTHLPYTTLPQSIKTSRCRILFISRNPLDSCVSQWHFYTKVGRKVSEDREFKSYSMQYYFEDCIDGKIMYGPFFEHVVEHWKMSLERPDKVLFLKYEDLKENPCLELKRLAKFVGMPFSQEEESRGVINEIIELCSINNLKDLEVNKNGVHHTSLETKDFFRKGIVGDWTNYFTPSMAERMHNLMEQKLEGTGLTFKLLLDP